MLHVALVGLLAGTLAVGSPDGGDAKKTTGDPPKTTVTEAEAPGIFVRSDETAEPRTVQDTYAFGRSDRNSPIRFWAHYGQGKTSDVYGTDGVSRPLQVEGTASEVGVRRVALGSELGLPVGLFGFGLGGGAQLTLAENSFDLVAANPALTVSDSDFGLQGLKLYGIARAGALSLHGGYIFDFGDDTEFSTTPTQQAFLPTKLGNSDGRDAIFFGAGFDYPTPGIRLFGAVDYFLLQAGGTNNPNTPALDEATAKGDDLMNALFGVGIRASIFELGAALQIQARLSNPVTPLGTQQGIGGSLATVSPYIRISPPIIPATIFGKLAVLNEYTETGIPIGGSNAPRPGGGIGFTAGLTVGFN